MEREGVVMRLKKEKGIGDSTSITIPQNFISYITGEEEPVTQSHLKLINDAIKKRKLIHLVMTGISIIEQHSNDLGDYTVNQKVNEIGESVKIIEDLLRGMHAMNKFNVLEKQQAQ